MTDVEKREKVIRGLELCAYDPDPGQELKEVRSCPECPYYRAGCSPQLIRDALALLREQEARVMMKEEIVLCTDWVWCEYTSGYQGWYRAEEYDTDYGLFRWEDTTTDIIDDYGFRWRAWTSRPSPEQMRDTPWKGEKDD